MLEGPCDIGMWKGDVFRWMVADSVYCGLSAA